MGNYHFSNITKLGNKKATLLVIVDSSTLFLKCIFCKCSKDSPIAY